MDIITMHRKGLKQRAIARKLGIRINKRLVDIVKVKQRIETYRLDADEIILHIIHQ